MINLMIKSGKKFLVTRLVQAAVLTSLLLSSLAYADFKEAEHAFRRGEYRIALVEFTRLAEEQYPPAQYHLGFMYENGFGVEKNYKLAYQWYQRASQNGYQYAQNKLADMLYYGRGVAQDYARAARWHEKAARKGIITSQFQIANMYRQGQGVRKNIQKAAYWYKKAASRGLPEAQAVLANMYSKGAGVSSSSSQAVRWARLAARQGNADAQYLLGNFYRRGVGGVPRDKVKAYVWIRMAAARKKNYQVQASKARNGLAGHQLARARKLLRRYSRRYNPDLDPIKFR
jgi:TPR repeat protein